MQSKNVPAVAIRVVLVVAVVLGAAIAGGGMFAFVLAGICGLVAFCRRYTRRAKQNTTLVQPGAMDRFRYHLCASGVRYLVPVGIAVAFYVLLSIYISLFGDSLSIDWLIAMQLAFEDSSQFFSDHLALNEIEVLAALVSIYALSCVLLSRREGDKEKKIPASGVAGVRARFVAALHRTIDLYGKYTGPVATCLAALASFTLFGMQLGEPSKDLRLRVKVAQAGYAEIAKRTEAELSQRVATALHGKIMDAFAPSYRAALKLPTRIDSSVADVRANADDADSTYGLSVPAVDRLLRDEAARTKKVRELRSDLRVQGTGRRGVPGSTTYNEVDAARKALSPHQSGAGVELIRVGRKKVILQVEKLASARIVAVTKPLTEAIPILEPLLQTFAGAADKTLQERLAKSYDRAMKAALRNPRARESTVRREAKTVISETNVKTLVDRATPRARRQTRRLRHALSSLTAGSELIDRRVVKYETDMWWRLRSLGIRDPILPSELKAPRIPYSIPDVYPSPGMGRPGSGAYPPGGVDPYTPPRTVVPPKPPPPKVPRLPFFIP